MPNPHELLTIEDLAQYLQVPVQTIYAWRSRGEGPRGRKVGRYVRFYRSDVERWLDAHGDPNPGPHRPQRRSA